MDLHDLNVQLDRDDPRQHQDGEGEVRHFREHLRLYRAAWIADEHGRLRAAVRLRHPLHRADDRPDDVVCAAGARHFHLDYPFDGRRGHPRQRHRQADGRRPVGRPADRSGRRHRGVLPSVRHGHDDEQLPGRPGRHDHRRQGRGEVRRKRSGVKPAEFICKKRRNAGRFFLRGVPPFFVICGTVIPARSQTDRRRARGAFSRRRPVRSPRGRELLRGIRRGSRGLHASTRRRRLRI